jgi:hypothetical protein
MGVKEKVIAALQSNSLKWDADFEKAIDRLTALGLSDPLGSALWRLKYLNDRAAAKRALYLLVHKAKDRLRGKDLDYVIAMAKGAIQEWLLDACGTCHGVGSITGSNGVRGVTCHKCEGTGLKRHTDMDRARYCALPAWNAGHNRNFEEVLICLAGSTAATGGKIRDLLRDDREGI